MGYVSIAENPVHSAKYQANTRLRARFLFVLTNLKTLKRRLGG